MHAIRSAFLLVSVWMLLAPHCFSITLDQRFPDCVVTDATYVQALLHVASVAALPMGIELKDSPAIWKPVNIRLRGKSVREALQAVVASVPGYELDLDNDIVHVLPTGARSDVRLFTNRYIPTFEVRNEYVRFASERLRRIVSEMYKKPEPQVWDQGKKQIGSAGHVATGRGDRQVSFVAEKTNVRGVLDKLIRQSDLKIWLVVYAGPIDTELAKTRSVYSNSPVVEQPVWQLLTWKSDPISRNDFEDWRCGASAATQNTAVSKR